MLLCSITVKLHHLSRGRIILMEFQVFNSGLDRGGLVPHVKSG